jgi:mycothiol S-conjugate amidase
VLAMHEKFLELGLESPFDDAWIERASRPQEPYTTEIDISDFGDVRRLALLAHATQVDPTSRSWFGLPPEVARTVHPVDEYILARTAGDLSEDVATTTAAAASAGRMEDDLFAGVRNLIRPAI